MIKLIPIIGIMISPNNMKKRDDMGSIADSVFVTNFDLTYESDEEQDSTTYAVIE